MIKFLLGFLQIFKLTNVLALLLIWRAILYIIYDGELDYFFFGIVMACYLVAKLFEYGFILIEKKLNCA
jgi:hypothetical protein